MPFSVILRHLPTQTWGRGPTLKAALKSLPVKVKVQDCVVTFTDADTLHFGYGGNIENTEGGTFLCHAYPEGSRQEGYPPGELKLLKTTEMGVTVTVPH